MASYSTAVSVLIPPYGNLLVDLVATGREKTELERSATGLPSIQLSPRSMCDLELLATGALSPLDRFMGRADYERVIAEMRLANGLLFPIPVTLPVQSIDGLELGSRVALRSPKNDLMAVLVLEEIFKLQPEQEGEAVLGTTDHWHPLVGEMQSWGRYALSGTLHVLRLPEHLDFPELRHTPAQVRSQLEQLGYRNVVAFDMPNPAHRAHEELANQVAERMQAALLLHPAVGLAKPGDLRQFTRVRTCEFVCERFFNRERTLLGVLPLATRFAGPREALWQALIHRNYGANCFIVGPHHASPRNGSSGSFYPAHAAQELVEQYSSESGVHGVRFDEVVFIPETKQYQHVAAVLPGQHYISVSEPDMSESCAVNGEARPEWLVRPEVAAVIDNTFRPQQSEGFCIWLTGLPSAGKSTIADHLTILLMEHGRQVTLLDGDVVRTHLSKGLGFSREDRNTNILRIGFVASEIVSHNGVVICAAVSPYQQIRDRVRAMMQVGAFIEVYVDTPVEVCERRDPKRFYAKAREGLIKNFTGVDDPYEPPLRPELRINTTDVPPRHCADVIRRYLVNAQLIRADSLTLN